jgi:hypothetical protein
MKNIVKKKNISKSQGEEYKFCDDPQKERYFTRHQSKVFSKQLENERTNPNGAKSKKKQMSTTSLLKQKSNSKRRKICVEEKEACSDHPENCQCAILKNMDTKMNMWLIPHFSQGK